MSIAYTMLWSACLKHGVRQQNALRRAEQAYQGAAKFANGAEELRQPLVELKAEIDNWSADKCDHYRKKSLDWHS